MLGASGGLDAVHYALAGAVCTVAGALVACAKFGFSYVAQQNKERLEDQKTSAKEKEKVLSKILPLVENITSLGEDMVTTTKKVITIIETKREEE
jgi:hypothetical protein